MNQDYFRRCGSFWFLLSVRYSSKTVVTENGSLCKVPLNQNISNRPEVRRFPLPPHQVTMDMDFGDAMSATGGGDMFPPCASRGSQSPSGGVPLRFILCRCTITN